MTAQADEQSTPILRDALIREATKLFAEQGYAATSMRQVAEAASCTKPALYYHFGSKEQLYLHIIAREVEILSDMIRGVVDDPGAVRPRLIRAARVLIEHAKANPHAMALLHRAEFQPDESTPTIDVGGTRQLHLQLVQQIIEQGKTRGEIRKSVNAEDCAVVLAATVSFQLQLCVFSGQPWPERQVERTLDLLFEGIAPS